MTDSTRLNPERPAFAPGGTGGGVEEVGRTATDPSSQATRAATEQGGERGALFPSTRKEEPADALGIGRVSIKTGDIRVFGKTVARIAPPYRQAALERGIANILGDLFSNRGPLSNHGKIQDHRNAEAVTAAVRAPLVPGGSLGPTVVFRPGLGNTAPGPAQIARIAQYTDRVIIAFANRGDANEQRLRPVDEVDGVPLPPEARGKVFAIGSPKNLMISFEQASDLFLEQLGAMSKAGVGGEAFDVRNATVIAHSQGGLDALLTRRRLVEAGVDHPFSRLITLATPFRGSPVSNEDMAGVFAEAGQALFDADSMGAVNALDPDHVKAVIHERDQRLVDLSLVGQTEAGRDGRKDLRTFFKISDMGIELARSFASIFKGRDVRENDGLVTVESQKFGAQQFELKKSYDHAGIAEDPAVIDEAVRLLARA